MSDRPIKIEINPHVKADKHTTIVEVTYNLTEQGDEEDMYIGDVDVQMEFENDDSLSLTALKAKAVARAIEILTLVLSRGPSSP